MVRANDQSPQSYVSGSPSQSGDGGRSESSEYSHHLVRGESRTENEVLYHLHDKFIGNNAAWGYDPQGKGTLEEGYLPHQQLLDNQRLQLNKIAYTGLGDDPTLDKDVSICDLFCTAEDWSWEWNNFNSLRKWMLIYEFFELVDSFGDVAFMCRIITPLVFNKREFEDYHLGFIIFLLALAIFVVAQFAYLCRGRLFKNSDRAIDSTDWKLSVPVLSLKRLTECSDLGVLNMARIYYSYSFLVRWLEDIPQLILAIVYMMNYGKDITSIFVTFTSCCFLIWGTLRLLLNFPYAAWFGQIFTRVTITEMEGHHAAGARKSLTLFVACAMWTYSIFSAFAIKFAQTDLQYDCLRTITLVGGGLGIVFLIIWGCTTVKPPKGGGNELEQMMIEKWNRVSGGGRHGGSQQSGSPQSKTDGSSPRWGAGTGSTPLNVTYPPPIPVTTTGGLGLSGGDQQTAPPIPTPSSRPQHVEEMLKSQNYTASSGYRE